MELIACKHTFQKEGHRHHVSVDAQVDIHKRNTIRYRKINKKGHISIALAGTANMALEVSFYICFDEICAF
jgi:hypothetical protein